MQFDMKSRSQNLSYIESKFYDGRWNVKENVYNFLLKLLLSCKFFCCLSLSKLFAMYTRIVCITFYYVK